MPTSDQMADDKWPAAEKHSMEKRTSDFANSQDQIAHDPERALSGTTIAKEEHHHHTHLEILHVHKFTWTSIVLAVFTFCLVVLAVTLGAVLGTRKHNAMLASTSGTTSNTSSPEPPRYPSIAVTVTNMTVPQSMLFYYDNERREIMVYSHNQSWNFHGALQSLPAQPRKGNSMAAVSWTNNGDISTRLFYIDSSSRIMQLSPSCDEGSACEYDSDHIILEPSSILPTSNLAAAHWGNSTSKRISLFYIGTGYKIHEMRSNSDGQFSGDNVLGIEVYPESSLAATWNSDLGNDMSVFLTSPDQKLQEYRFEGIVWQTPTDIQIGHDSGVSISAYSPTANMAVTTLSRNAVNSDKAQTRTYRIDVNGYPVEISSEVTNRSTTGWQAITQPQWLKSDDVQGGGIAAASWLQNGQYSARLYYASNDVVSEMAFDGTKWSVGTFQSN